MNSRTVDLTGMEFGMLTVIKQTGSSNLGRMWLCECKCGNLKEYPTCNLLNGCVKSCGCLRESRKVVRPGKVFGRLTVLEKYDMVEVNHKTGKRVSRYLCKCKCGNECIVKANDLRSGGTQSCGCYKRDRIREALKHTNEYEIDGNVVHMFTRKGEEFLISTVDLDMVLERSWCINDKGYVISTSPTHAYLHNYILGTDTSKYYGDHINHDRLDNRRENLRIVTPSQNRMNSGVRKDTPFGVVGVFKSGDRYGARISKNHKTIFLGYFDTVEEATKCRLAAEKEYFGEYNNKDRDNL
jgi:hypothetical protein